MARGETPARLVPPLHRCDPSMNLKRATDHSTRKAAGAAVAPAPTNGNGHGGNGHASVPGASAYIGDGQSQVGRRLSDFLLAEGLITATQFSTVLAEQKKTNEKLATLVVRLGLMTEEQMMHAQSLHYRIPSVKFPESIPAEILRLVPGAIARKHEVLPIGRSAGALTLAMVDPTNLSAVDDVAFRTGMRVFPVVAQPSLIRQALEQLYEPQKSNLATALTDAETGTPGEGDEKAPSPLELQASAEHAPVVKLVNMIILDAIARGASDIHLEPGERYLQVRFRIDGVLQDVMTPAKRLEPALVSRIKIMASLDIAERRLPQDGRIKFRDSGREMDFR